MDFELTEEQKLVQASVRQFMLEEIAPYPDRMYLEAMVGPILRRGVDNAIWELEYLVKECNAKLCKVYQPEDLGRPAGRGPDSDGCVAFPRTANAVHRLRRSGKATGGADGRSHAY